MGPSPFRRAVTAERRFLTVLALLTGLPLLAACPAAAEEPAVPADRAAAPDSAAPVRRVGDVTVTATRAERDVLDVAGNVTVIDREEIDRSGVRSLPDLLRRQPGLYLTATTTNPSGVQVEARGFNNGGGLGSSLLVQVNGRRVNEADTGSTDWALLELDEIDRIEIVRGPASALYGDNAVGGVVNIRTRPVEGPPRATLRGHLGRYDTGGGSLRAAASAGWWTGGVFVDGRTTSAYRRGADFDSQDVKGSFQARIGERVLVGASGGWYRDERGLPGGLLRDPDAIPPVDQVEALGRRAQSPDSVGTGVEVEKRYVDGWLDAELADDVLLRVQPYYRWRDDAANLVFAEGALRDIDDRAKSSLGVNALIQVDRPLFGLRNRLITGFDYLRDDTDRSDAFTGSFESLQLSKNVKSVYAGLVQDELNLTDALLLSAGVRFDRAEYDLRSVDGLDPTDSATARPAYAIWSPKAALSWRFLPAGSAYFSYSRGFRLPNFDENAPTLTGGPPVIPDLSPQISDAFEIGGKWRSPRIDASLTLYWMDVEDEIILNPLLNCFPGFGCFGQNDNVERSRHRGIELSLAVSLLDWLTGYANYTLDDATITEAAEPELEGARMPMTPLHRGNLGLVARLPLDLEVTAHALFVDERIVANDFDRQAPRIDPYATLDLLLAWRPRFGEHLRGALTFALRNLNGAEYDDLAVRSVTSPTRVAFYPAAIRTWEVGLMLTVER